jgi:hypothetical protein
MADQMIGMVGRVTGRVRPGHIGEVMLAVRGGIEAFYAEPYDGQESIAEGAECVVVDYRPSRSRTVLVTAMPKPQDAEGVS